MKKSQCLTLLSLGLLVSACGSDEQTSADTAFPDGDLQFIVHTSAGGPADLMTRELAAALEEVIDHNVIVENRPGGSGATQMNAILNADPDGYTLGTLTPSQVGIINGTLSDQYSLDDFTWLLRSQIDPYILAVHDNSPFETLEDFVDAASESPGTYTVGGFGATGSGHNIAFNIFSESANIDAAWTPYESTGDAVTALLGEHIDVANSNPGAVAEYVEAGTLRILAVMSDERLDAFPDVPTYAELGYEVDTDWVQFRGLFGPPDMPEDVKDELSELLLEAMETERYQQYMQNAYMVEGPFGHVEMDEFVRTQSDITLDWYEILGYSE